MLKSKASLAVATVIPSIGKYSTGTEDTSEKDSSALAFTEFVEVNKILNDNWDCNGG